MRAFVLMIAGALLPLMLRSPPPSGSGLALALLGLLSAVSIRTRWFALLALPAALTLAIVEQRLAQRLDPALAGQELAVTGVVVGLPVARDDLLEFRFRPTVRTGLASQLPDQLWVRWYRDWPSVEAGETWRLQLRLRLPRSRVNFSGGDAERWYFSTGIGGLASVREGRANERLHEARGPSVSRIRQHLREALARYLPSHEAAGLVAALAIADRSQLRQEQWRALRATGTGHLLAISGMHVGLAALFGYWLTRLASCLVPAVRWRWGLRPAWAGAALAAAGYAALAGFGVSTQRALLMLVVATAGMLRRRALSRPHAYALVVLLTLLASPLAPLSAGFWLSFLAVAALLLMLVPARHRGGWLARFTRLQLGLMVFLLPVTLYSFQEGTLLGLPGNLVAIPWVSLVAAPLLFLGMACWAVGLPADAALFMLSAEALGALGSVLAWLGGVAEGATFRTGRPPLPGVVLGLAGGALFLLPRGLLPRWPGALLLGALVVPVGPRLEEGEWRLDMLDVGQGLAALVATRHGLLAYDTGPGQPGRWDLVAPVLVPAIAASGFRAPKRVVVSHGDLDHAGGLDTLRRQFAQTRFLVNQRHPAASLPRCLSPENWQDSGIGFRILHPGPGLPYLGNASSCVLSVGSDRARLLLPGDIDTAVEQRLVERGLGRHAILIAPHHGSRSSSSHEFLQAVQPELVLISAGADNRFGLPHVEIVERYHQQGARVLSTAGCGGLRLTSLETGRITLASARRQRPGLWRWPAAHDCP